jgi:hypothetical protein
MSRSRSSVVPLANPAAGAKQKPPRSRGGFAMCSKTQITGNIRSLAIRELILGCHALDIFRLASYSVPQAPVRLDGKSLDDGVDLGQIDHDAALRTLRLVMDVIV